MAFDVHIHVAFSCSNNEPVARIARRHLQRIDGDEQDGVREAAWFLESLSTRLGGNPGPKGGLSLWGMVGNYTRGDAFCEALRPFWEELLDDSRNNGTPLHFEHVLVFVEEEGSEAMTVYEVSNEAEDGEPADIQIKKHEGMPFCANQH